MLQKYLEQIEHCFSETKAPVREHLSAGLGENEINDLLSGLDLTATKELVDLYKWKNGAWPVPGFTLGEFCFIPGYFFLPLSRACSEYSDLSAEEDWDKNWLPILTSGGGEYYAADLSRSFSEPSSVIEYAFEDPGIEVPYKSLTNMIQVFVECFKRKAFFLDAETGYLEANIKAWGEIERTLKPDSTSWK